MFINNNSLLGVRIFWVDNGYFLVINLFINLLTTYLHDNFFYFYQLFNDPPDYRGLGRTVERSHHTPNGEVVRLIHVTNLGIETRFVGVGRSRCTGPLSRGSRTFGVQTTHYTNNNNYTQVTHINYDFPIAYRKENRRTYLQLFKRPKKFLNILIEKTQYREHIFFCWPQLNAVTPPTHAPIQ